MHLKNAMFTILTLLYLNHLHYDAFSPPHTPAGVAIFSTLCFYMKVDPCARIILEGSFGLQFSSFPKNRKWEAP